ncbi:MAG: NUDIX domain-containing protein [Rhodospirillaceae bacterium]|nr:NUDIX domain-containing protein [Rhodospirillaceae bacterium]
MPVPLPTVLSVIALFHTEDGRYLMQLRDSTKGIWFPRMWCLFGGGVKAGENPVEALRREIKEELDFVPETFSYFSRVGYEVPDFAPSISHRYAYESRITQADVDGMVQHEGAGKRLMSAEDILSGKYPIIGPDLVILHLHLIACGIIPAPDPAL